MTLSDKPDNVVFRWAIPVIVSLIVACYSYIVFNSSGVGIDSSDTSYILHRVKNIIRPERPNIIFFLADDLGWNDVGYHGSIIKTPTIDRLAKEGVKLENYYVQPVCTPSRAALLTGRYVIHTGLQHKHIEPCQPNGLSLNETLLPELLKRQGYSTYMVGKWHLGFFKKEYTPENRGFDRYCGIYVGCSGHYNHILYPHGKGGYALMEDRKVLRDPKNTYSTHLYTNKIMEYIADHLRETPHKPFFAFVSYQAVHGPLQVPKSYQTPYVNLTTDKNRIKLAGMTTCMDESIKNITDYLKREGVWENSLAIFSTDNGGNPTKGSSNYPLRHGKQSLYEGGVRGVAFATGPIINKPKRVSHDLMHISDWAPTILHLVGANISHLNLDGHNMWSVISNGSKSTRQEVLLNIDPLQPEFGQSLSPPGVDFNTGMRAAIRQGPWKLLTGFTLPPSEMKHSSEFFDKRLNMTRNVQLYNVVTDPVEAQDCYHKNPEVVKALLLRLAEYNQGTVPASYPPWDMKWNPSAPGGSGIVEPWM